MKGILNRSHVMDSSLGFAHKGWDDCSMRSYLNNDIFSQLSIELQNVIKFVNKNANSGRYPNDIKTSSDKLWLLCVEEICGENKYSSGSEGVQYEYWILNSDTFKSYDGIHGGNWWLRTSYVRLNSDSTTSFAYVNGPQSFPTTNFTNYLYVSFCFCI